MRDIPMFTTENGVTSLVLREIPFCGIAYVTIQSSLEVEKLLEECVTFCKMAGADRIYATGHEMLGRYPFHTAIWQLEKTRDGLPVTDAVIRPLTTETLELWRKLHNERMSGIPNSATLTRSDVEGYMQKGNAWFVYRGEKMLGLGVVSGDKIESIVSVVPGAGMDVLLALCSEVSGDTITLEVSSENLRALNLYRKLGFEKTEELSLWYDVTK